MTEVDYGADFSCTTGLDGTMRLVSGSELMSQVCLRRLYCRRGFLFGAPDQVTVDVRDFVGESYDRSLGTGQIIAQCQAAILGDERMYSAEVSAVFSADGRELLISASGVGSQGPFSLRLSVSELTVTVLRDA